mmetsp:Transcript_29215/g.42886  ORF Transcript_29215/g.42886 Transcript_29215/m.42886 type:complete len:228 (-) Transcript_29215:267-950(-)|eukprot:CAMPEP_0116030818 /NCGR_PEP_ID=MMETSP0321-20121206/17100_1 /TAXON_ID=163516 /ORGANISM="Leptocylindrus danicus var. danicus, Strain B650" /LENGTH=227 /DNA_ID=CAMNT_0003505735 /DNA_START=212 /DNA_END=895 /DNA_ORIENTATION=-
MDTIIKKKILYIIILLSCTIELCQSFRTALPLHHPGVVTAHMQGYGIKNYGRVQHSIEKKAPQQHVSIDDSSFSSSSLQMSSNFDDPPPKEGSYEALAARPVLAALDMISILLFAAVGKASHSAVDGSIDFLAVGVTAFPFLVSWFSIAPLMGSYDALATQDAVGALLYTARGWGFAVPVGCALRGVIKGYIPPTSFVIVTMISTLVILGGSRALYAVVREKLAMFP